MEDPRRHLNDGTLTEYCLELYREYHDLAVDMYEKFASKFPEIPRCKFHVCMSGPIDFENRLYMNGIHQPPAYIEIYLFNLNITAFDHCIRLHRNDIDTVFKANLAFTILHEMSHIKQNTYVIHRMIPAMEYANDLHVWNNMIPVVELILKRNYKVNLYKDMVDESAGKVFSYGYIPFQSNYERLIRFFVYNTVPDNTRMTLEEEYECKQYLSGYDRCSNINVTLSFTDRYGKKTEFHSCIKQNGILNEGEINNLLQMIMNFMPYQFSLKSLLDFDDNIASGYVEFHVSPPKEYNPFENQYDYLMEGK